jgi:hypothetical protein
MTLKEKFHQWLRTEPYSLKDAVTLREAQCEVIAEEFAIGFAEWKDNNFLMYKDDTYYAKTSSQYFDIRKYIGKEKPTKYYTTKELLEIYKKEKGL